MKKSWILRAGALAVLLGLPGAGLAWDYEGHRLVNQLALASLPTNFPAFVRAPAARERIAFLGGEADRWRNVPDLTFKHLHGPDHFLDLDDLPAHGLKAETLTPFRYVFTAQLAAARAARPGDFPPIDPARDADQTKALVGFLPWTITEHYARLKSAFSCLRAFEESGGTADELENTRQNIIYLMGVMGHFVADATQPLHTTRHYNGWVGDNPRSFTTSRSFHQWIDGGCIDQLALKAEELAGHITPARPLSRDRHPGAHTNLFPVVVGFLLEQHRRVEPLYQLEKAGKLTPGREIAPEGRAFITGQLLKAAQMLGEVWLTAWRYAPPDRFLNDQLSKRATTPARSAGGGSAP